MCIVSMMGDFYGRTAPQNPLPSQPVFVPWPTGAPASLPWTQEAFDLFKEIMKKVDTLDKKLGLGECEDTEKTKWMKAIEERLKALEPK
jgi:hypothetical protein